MNPEDLKVGDWVQLVKAEDDYLDGTGYEIGKLYQVTKLGPYMGIPSSWINCIDPYSNPSVTLTAVYLRNFRLLDPFQVKVLQARNQLTHGS
ncbi:hypothetical protein [Spirosoma oryzae]|uniref:hypothetical protein n=1 Tax=Spirosoma oryzae TaxID=1469603 RepID=UPI0011B1E0C7|nr:hypothetical protein [Spirosoma oryzae]